MASAGLGSVVRQVERLFGGGTVSGLDEAALLRRFVQARDPAALDALVARHGPMVLGVCRRIVGNTHDAEDAFQATFLVLVKKARSIRDAGLLGPWLHGVAHRVAVRARANAAIRRKREGHGAEDLAMAAEGGSGRGGLGGEAAIGIDRAELRAALDDEIARLPERFRRAVVLCYLDGLTHEEAAERLRCPVGTVRSRLAAGRAKLRDRLARRGVGVGMATAAFASALSAEAAKAAVPPALAESTLAAGLALATSGTIAAVAGASGGGTVPPSVASLADGVMTTMFFTKLKVMGAVVLAGALTVGAGGVAARQLNIAVVDPAQADGPLDDAIAKLKAEAKRSEERTEALQKKAEALEAEIGRLKSENQKLREKGAIASDRPAAGRGGAVARDSGGQHGAAAGGGGVVQGGNDPFGEANAAAIYGRGGLFGTRSPDGQANPPGGGGQGYSAAMRGGVRSGMTGQGTGFGGGGGQGYGPVYGVGGGLNDNTNLMGVYGNRRSIASLSTANYIIVQKPETGRVSGYSAETDEWSSYSIPKGMKVAPIGTGSIVALAPEGEEVRQLAVYLPKSGKWFPIDLKAPSAARIVPMVMNDLAAFTAGRRVYAFSGQAGRWDVLELEEEAKAAPVLNGNRVTVEHKDHLYIFGAKSGKWVDFDANTGEVAGGGGEKK